MTTYIRYCILFIALLSLMHSHAQSASEVKKAAKIFGGQWVDKKTSRHLHISFNEEDEYATITDWTSKFQKQESGDVYKAFVENGKLVMPEDTEHHAPNSEMISKDNKLIYLTKNIGPGGAFTWEKQIFIKDKW